MRGTEEIEPVLTNAFNSTVLALEKAITQRKIICVVGPEGIGFKFAVKRFAMKHYLKIIYADVAISGVMHEVLCAIDDELSNVKFSNIDRRNITLHQLTLRINERIHSDDCCLMILDNCNLTPAQLGYFVRFLKNFNRKIGLVFRISNTYFQRLKNWKKWKSLYNKLYEVTDGWKGLDELTKEELKDICKANGVMDQMIIDNVIIVSEGNLSILKKHIDRYQELKRKDHETSKKPVHLGSNIYT